MRIRVPEQVALVGFDDDAVACRTRPLLTTVRQPVEEMGARAVAELLGRAEGQVVMATTLVLRESA
jgi:DNA-binding LacI/PurR family transcriptional regulator